MVLETEVRALDTAISQLEREISAARASGVNEPFREAWRAFTARWQIQRDAWLGAGDITRKFGFSESVYNDYRAGYLRWLADFQKRIAGAAATPPRAIAPPPSMSLFGGLFAGSGTTLLLTAVVVGGVFYASKQKGKTWLKRSR